jgi:hypothetical protein
MGKIADLAEGAASKAADAKVNAISAQAAAEDAKGTDAADAAQRAADVAADAAATAQAAAEQAASSSTIADAESAALEAADAATDAEVAADQARSLAESAAGAPPTPARPARRGKPTPVGKAIGKWWKGYKRNAKASLERERKLLDKLAKEAAK